MKKLRIILIPFAVAFELILAVIAVLLILKSPNKGRQLIDWVQQNMPDNNWYFGHE